MARCSCVNARLACSLLVVAVCALIASASASPQGGILDRKTRATGIRPIGGARNMLVQPIPVGIYPRQSPSYSSGDDDGKDGDDDGLYGDDDGKVDDDDGIYGDDDGLYGDDDGKYGDDDGVYGDDDGKDGDDDGVYGDDDGDDVDDDDLYGDDDDDKLGDDDGHYQPQIPYSTEPIRYSTKPVSYFGTIPIGG